MFQHVVLLKFGRTASGLDRQHVVASIESLAVTAPGVNSLSVFTNVGDSAGNFDVIVQISTLSEADYLRYHASAEHDIVDAAITPYVDSRSAIQYVDA